MRTKPLLQSKTIYGALLAIASKFTMFKVSNGEAQDLVTQVTVLAPLLAGLYADGAAMYKRVRATKFNISWYKSGVFWAAIVSAFMGVLQAVGVDWSGLEQTPEKLGAVFGAAGTLLSTVLMIWGRSSASKAIGLPPPQDLGIMPGWLSSGWDKLARPFIVAFVQNLVLRISRLDGKPGLTIADLEKLTAWMKDAAKKWQDNNAKFTYVKELLGREFGSRLSLSGAVSVLDVVIVLWHAVLKLQNKLPPSL
jgi:hypothetical protein